MVNYLTLLIMNTFLFRTMLIVALMTTGLTTLRAQLKFDPDNRLYIGPRTNTISSTAPGIYITTEWAIENFESGLNFFRGWPNSYYGNYLLFIDQTGKVGIGRKPITYALEVYGQVWTSAGVLVASDKKLKKNIKDLSDNDPDYLNKLFKLSGKSYDKQISSTDDNASEVANMVAKGKIKNEDASAALYAMNKVKPNAYKKEFGFLAQDVKELFPELVEENADGIQSINYTELIPLLLESIKEQSNRIDELEKSVAKLSGSFVSKSSSVNNSTSSFTSLESISANPTAAVLNQNVPNPFSQDTQIKIYIPGNVNTATITIYNMEGKQLMQYPLSQRGQGSQFISGHHFSAGMYLYSLIVDGTVVDMKRMILTK